MLQWTIGLNAVVPIFNVWHILMYMKFLVECFWNKHMFMIIYFYFFHRLFLCVIFLQNISMLTFDLDIFEYILS